MARARPGRPPRDITLSKWTSEKPFDFRGKYHQVEVGFSALRPRTPIDIFIAGASDAAIDVAGRHADVFAPWGEICKQVSGKIDRVSAAAAQGPRLDKRQWTALSQFTGAKGNSTSLVGTPD
jgi:alkanesulfonate monooxygenase SsuD/methylene tetrahydromethanopterin reductase-like flavin-dependent oxidoreductase (luciferase family)